MTAWLVVISTVLLSAMFSGLEIAFVSANKFHIELQSKKNIFPYVMLAQLAKNPARFIATMLVGNNLTLVLYGIFVPDLMPFLSSIQSAFFLLLAQTLLSTVVILFFAEFIPKNLFNTHSEALLKIFAIPAWIFFMLFYPFVGFIIWLSDLIMSGVFNLKTGVIEPAFSRVDLNDLLQKHTDNLGASSNLEPEIEILKNALGFSERKAREFMVPRTEIVALEINDGVAELQAAFIKSGLSKILIYRKKIDNVIGYVHSYEMFYKPLTIKEVLKPILFIPESMAANDVLNLFTKERRGLAVVVDEFGGTAGLVTLEDVVEEIVGEIDDEHDTDVEPNVKIDDHTFQLSARAEIDYLNDKFDLELPESESYSTLGGLIFELFESIPEAGQVIQFQNYSIEIRKVSSNRIEEVCLKILEE